MINYQTRQKITAQALKEIAWAREYKQGKTKHWQMNERLYYGMKEQVDTSRSNVDLGKMQEFIHTILSKIDSPMLFKFLKRKNSQLKRVARLNALRAVDQDEDDWDMKDLVGKKQAMIYGRAIFGYHADSEDGSYHANLENIDVYNFLIDPSAGGVDLEEAWFLGDYGIVKSKAELEDGVRNKLYLKTETQRLIDGSGNSLETTQEVENTQPRTRDTDVWQTQKQIGNPEKFVFWRWYTTFEGKRYYLLLNDRGGTAIRVEELKDVFENGQWPYWSYAAYVDQTEFWTPSPADYAREIFMAQSVSINQLIENAEQRNRPQRVVNISAIKNLSQLKYQRGGNFIEASGTEPVASYIQNVEVPQLDTPVTVYNLLESIQEKASGVTAGSKGDAEGDGKATIYEGNQANAADRFGLINRSYGHGYKRFAKLWMDGVKEHLTKKVAIEILGPDGVEIESVSRRDIFKKDDDFKVSVESSNAETAQSELEKRTKIQFLTQQQALPMPIQNPKKAYEIAAQIAGFDEDTIRQLLDTSEFGDADLMSEADRDIEDILEGQDVKPNKAATTAYKQRFIDYMQDNEQDINPEQANKLFAYIDQLDPIIMQNMARAVDKKGLDMTLAGMPQPGVTPGQPPMPGQPAPPEPPMQDPSASINQLAPNGV